jgi:ketosteroid isomerase-like protein
VESEILDGTGRLADTLRRGDAPAAGELYSDTATLLASGAAPMRGRAEVEAYWRAGLELGLSGLEFERHELEHLADTVLELGRYAVALRGSTETRRERGSYLVLHTQTADGSWRRAVEVYSPGEPAPARRDRGKEER